MQTTITKTPGGTTVHLAGRLDTPASLEVSKELEPVIQNATGEIVLECSELEYISSSGLRIFLTLRKAAASKGGKVIVKNISKEIRQVFMITGFLSLFEIQGDE